MNISTLRTVFGKIITAPVVADVLAFLGGGWFLASLLHQARTLPSMLDEGTYLVKGLLYVSGRYTPFQEYGPWTNQMPLSYLIPGLVQYIFPSGLRTGRYFSIFLALFMVVGLWILARRFGGRWWGAAAVWVVALNPVMARSYSLAVSQVLVVCMLTWIFVLALDKKAANWRLIVAGSLSGLLIVTRVNMLPVWPCLILWMIWQFGARRAIWPALAGGASLLLVHAFYWPGILQIWASWLPSELAPFLKYWQSQNTGSGVWKPAINFLDRLSSLLDGLRYNLPWFVSLIFFGIFIYQPRRWKDSFYFKTALFLSVLIWILILAHAWASLSKSYCVYCFSSYLAFFSPLMFLIAILVFKAYQPGPARWIGVVILLLLILVMMGVGFGAQQEIGTQIAEIAVPRLKLGGVQSGSIPIWGLLENGLGINRNISQQILPTLAGIGLAVLLVIVSWVLFRRNKMRTTGTITSFALLLSSGMLLLSVLLSPFRLLSGLDNQETCQADILTAMQGVGDRLNETIPVGAKVYWNGGQSAVPLLSLSLAQIYPAQLNDVYSYRKGGDKDTVARSGLWNKELRDQWLRETDFVIIREDFLTREWKEILGSGQYTEVSITPSINPCEPKQRLVIFFHPKGPF